MSGNGRFPDIRMAGIHVIRSRGREPWPGNWPGRCLAGLSCFPAGAVAEVTQWRWPGGRVHVAGRCARWRPGLPDAAWDGRRGAPGGRLAVMAGGDSGAGAGLGWRWDVALSFAGAQRDSSSRSPGAEGAGPALLLYADEQIGLWGSTWPRSCRPSTGSRRPRWWCSSRPSISIGTGPGWSGGRRWAGRCGSGGSTCCRPGSMTRPCPGCCRNMVTVDLRRYTPGSSRRWSREAGRAGHHGPGRRRAAVPLAGPVDLVLTVTGGQVRLAGGGVDASAGHGGVRAGLAEAVNEARRARDRAGLPVRGPGGGTGGGRGAAAGAGGAAAGGVVPAGPGAARWRGCWRGRSGRTSWCGSGLEVPASWRGCRGRRCRPRTGGARWRCTRWSACTARRTPRRGGGCRGRCGSWWRSPPPIPAAGRCWIMSGSCGTCWPRSAAARRARRMCGWCRSLP